MRHGGGREQLWVFTECKDKFPEAYNFIAMLDSVFNHSTCGINFPDVKGD